MVGEINETYLSDLHSRTTDKEQTSFEDFVENQDDSEELGTTIAVVSDPTGGIVEASDEFMPELGMPERELNNFRSVRSDLDIEDSTECHNRAVDITDIDQKYAEHIETDDEAAESIHNLAKRVSNGENITFICFEKEPKWCHRHILAEKVTEEAKKID